MKLCLHCMELYDDLFEVCPFCGYVNDGQTRVGALAPGTILKGRYVLGTVIGQGGFGVTYIAWDKKLNNRIAVKEYYPISLAKRDENTNEITSISSKTSKSFELGKQKYIDEARIIASIEDCENVVDVYDFIFENGTAYIVMEYLDGTTLKNELKSKKKYGSEAAVELISSVAKSLAAVHNKGIIHRDISPDNIMLVDGKTKLLDFGAARNFEESNTEMSVILKAGYAPPEQFSKKSVQDERTDIYALGAVFYQLLTGIKPETSLARQEKDTLKAPSKINDYIPKWIDRIVMKCMELKPEDRFANAEELLEAISLKENYNPNKGKKSVFHIVGVIIVVIALFIVGTLLYLGEGNLYRGKQHFEQRNVKSDYVVTDKGIKIEELSWEYDADAHDVTCCFYLTNNNTAGVTDYLNSLRLYAKNSEGETLGKSECDLNQGVYPGCKTAAVLVFKEICEEKPAYVVLETKDINISGDYLDEIKKHGFKKPEIKNIVVNGNSCTFDFINKNPYSMELYEYAIIYRDDDGNIIGSEKGDEFSIDIGLNTNTGVINVDASTTTQIRFELMNKKSDNIEIHPYYKLYKQ